MKNLITLFLITILLSCESKPFTGYVVSKTYEEGHNCHDDNYKVYEEFNIIPFIYIHHQPKTHTHKYIKPLYKLHIANKSELRHINVSSETYYKTKLLDKITISE